MEKKWFVALLMVVVMMCVCWTGAVAEDERDYQYALLDDGTVEITGYNGKAEKLTIPNMLNGKKVTSIDNRAFYLCNSLISIIIPDSVAKISVNPFAYCSTLKRIFVSSEHPYFFAIDGVLFRKADSCLISYPKGREYTTYNIPQGITAIGNSAFFCCDSLISVAIPDSVISIRDSAFSCCKSLTSITIPDSVTTIGDSAFSACDSLRSIIIPDSVTTIGGSAFYYCESLRSITIPDSVTSIGDSAFSECYSLTSVIIPDSVTSIGDSAFSECYSLTSVIIPGSVTSIGASAFSWCKSLTSITIPDSVTSIGASAFSWCKSLTSVTIPDSVTSIDKDAFKECTNLTLTVPRNSYAAEYAKTNNIPYTYPDANDWLNN